MARILIADDNQQNAELLEAHLDGTDYEVRIAVNGEETVHIADEWQPDVILLDIMMPKLSGFDVCKKLRSQEATQTIGILMVTALDQATDVERAVEVGTDDFITKPINRNELLLRIKALLESKQELTPVDRGLAYFRRVELGLN